MIIWVTPSHTPPQLSTETNHPKLLIMFLELFGQNFHEFKAGLNLTAMFNLIIEETLLSVSQINRSG